VLLGSSLSDYNWVDALEMRRICKDLDSNLTPVRLLPGEGGSQVILHISGSILDISVRSDALELCENNFQRFSNNVGKHVQSTSVWHSNNYFLGSVVS